MGPATGFGGPSPLLAIATGLLEGGLQNRDHAAALARQKRQDELDALSTAAKIVQTPGLSLESIGPNDAVGQVAAGLGASMGGIPVPPPTPQGTVLATTAPNGILGTARRVIFNPADTPAGQKKAQREQHVRGIMQAYGVPRDQATLLADNPSALAAMLKPTDPQLVRDEHGAYVPIDKHTGLGPDGNPVKGYTAPVQPSFTAPTNMTGPNGRPMILNTKSGQMEEAPDGTGRTSGGGYGASGAQAPVDDMVQRYDEIERAAQDLANGVWKLTPAMQTREGLTYGIARQNAEGKKVPLSQLGAATIMDWTGLGKGEKDPSFQRFQALMNSTRALGDDAAKVFKGRQNEEGVLREVALAQLTPDDYNNPQVVAQKLSRLRNVIRMAAITNPNQIGDLDAATRARFGIEAPAAAGASRAPRAMRASDTPMPGETKAQMWDRLVQAGTPRDRATQVVTAAFGGG